METSLELNAEEIKLEHVLGDGTLGTVYKGIVRQNAVAIKLLNSALFDDPAVLEAFRRELEALSFIRHPNLCLFMGYTLNKDKVMVVNEYLKSSLEVFLEDKEKSTVTLLERLRMAKEAALGLSWLHRNHIAHRELKPSNILLDANNHAKVADYGLARVRQLTQRAKFKLEGAGSPEQARQADLMTSIELTSISTIEMDEVPYWTAPELLAQLATTPSLNSAVASLQMDSTTEPPSANTLPTITPPTSRVSYEKADIYSFGVILWQLLTRQEPFSRVTPSTAGSLPPYVDLHSFIQAVVIDKVRPEMPSDTIPALQELIKDCLDFNPNRRPPFQAIVKRLDHIIVDSAIRDPLANKFWKDSFLNSGGDTVKWKDFCNSFATFLGLTVPGSLNVLDLIAINHHKVKDTTIPLDVRCLHAIMVQKDNTAPPTTTQAAPTTSTADDLVHMDHFGRMMDWFGPIKKNARATILTRIREVLQKPWFHGDIPTPETETRIMTREVGTFLVRFSNSAPGVFAISKVAAPLKVNHLRVTRDTDDQGNSTFRLGSHVADSLDALIEQASADYGLTFPCANPPYAYLFAEQAPIGVYVEGGKVPALFAP